MVLHLQLQEFLSVQICRKKGQAGRTATDAIRRISHVNTGLVTITGVTVNPFGNASCCFAVSSVKILVLQ
jgi:hypothetical protein